MGASLSKLIQDITSLMNDIIVNHSPTCTSIYHSQGALTVFLLAGLLLRHGTV